MNVLGLGPPVLLERPIRTMTLVSSVRAAIRARQRQYEIRDALIELKDGQETLQAVLDNLPVGIVLARATGEIVLTNQSVERIQGHPVIRSPTSKSHDEWIAFHSDGRHVQANEFPLVRAIKSGIPGPPEEYLYQRGDGSLGWISLTASPIIGDRQCSNRRSGRYHRYRSSEARRVGSYTKREIGGGWASCRIHLSRNQ